MGKSVRNRLKKHRGELLHRLSTGTDRRARKHQRLEARLAIPRCPKCGAVGVEEQFMRGGTHADGEPLDYWRCVGCRSLYSRLTGLRQEASPGAAGMPEPAESAQP